MIAESLTPKPESENKIRAEADIIQSRRQRQRAASLAASHNKDPSIWGWDLWYAYKPGGGMGKALSIVWAGDYSKSVQDSSL
jgi:hypothetical protein